MSCSSEESSSTRMRSSSGTNDDSALSIEVLPEPVPPATTMLRLPSTQARRKSRHASVSAPTASRRSTVSRSLGKRRIDMHTPARAAGGSMTATRLPSGRRASRMGCSASTMRPTYCATFLTAAMSACSEGNDARVLLDLAAALDEDAVEAVDHDLGDAIVGEERPPPARGSLAASGRRCARRSWLTSLRAWAAAGARAGTAPGRRAADAPRRARRARAG